MSFRTTLIIAFLLVLLGAYAYFFEYKGTKKKQEQEEKQKTLLEIKKEDIAEITITGLEQPVKLVPVKADIWQMSSPLQTRADEATVSRIVSNFEKLKYRDIVDEKPKDLAQYELDKPKVAVTISFKKGNAPKTIKIGSKNPVDNVAYVSLNNDPRVYTVDAAVADIASTTIFDLRDKKLTDFNSEKVESISLKRPQLDLEFKKEAGIWRMKKPMESPAADSEVSSLLSTLEFLRATKFVEEPSPDLSQYGLKEPSAVIELLLEKGLQQKIYFGNKVGQELYCRVEGTPGIAFVSDSFTTHFEKNLNEWREKKVIVFNRYDTEELRIKAGGKEYVFKKDKDEKWHQESPVKGEIDADKIQGLLEKLETAEITEYGKEASLGSSPVMEIFVIAKDWQDKVTRKHISFGLVQNNLLPVKNDDYNSIILTSASIQQELEKQISELKPKSPSQPQTKK